MIQKRKSANSCLKDMRKELIQSHGHLIHDILLHVLMIRQFVFGIVKWFDSFLSFMQGNFVRIIDKISSYPTCIAYNPRGTILACSCDDHHIYFYSTFTRTMVHSIYAHSSTISSIEFNKTGSLLLSSSIDGYWYYFLFFFHIVVFGNVKVGIVSNSFVYHNKESQCILQISLSTIQCICYFLTE